MSAIPPTDGSGPPDAIKVVTVSGSYGAGTSVIAPAIARRLGLPFADRAVSPSQVHQLSEGLAPNEQEEGWLHRLIAGASRMPAVIGVSLPPPPQGLSDLDRFRAENEQVICHLMETTGGVVLGRGAAAFLGHQPGCYHVRLDGPPEDRIKQAAEIEHISIEEAKQRQAETDRARALYSRRFYDRDINDATLYHLVLDSTKVPLEAAEELIVTAVKNARR